MDVSQILGFMLVVALLVMSPGPNGALIAKLVPVSGRGAGFAAVAGIASGFYLHGALSILGISVLLVQSATAFTIVKTLGAVYLIWLGTKALWAAFRGIKPVAPASPGKRRRTFLAGFGEGFLTNALNPKVSMFYLAAFPQFISMGNPSPLSAVLLVALHSLIAVVWFGAMVVLFDRITGVARSGRFQRWLKGVTGAVFIGFGIKLATIRPAL